MKPITFYKMTASGNDFIVIDNRCRSIKSPSSFTKKVSARCLAVGADGVLLAEKSRHADIKMRIINADGSEPEMCGNGIRCFALFCHRVLRKPSRLKIETKAGIVDARVRGSQVCAHLMNAKNYQPAVAVKLHGRVWRGSFINTGVPHMVFFVKSLERFPVTEVGRAVRWHKRFKPKGTNVNFVIRKGSRNLFIRTYERGVEGETLACGTGSVAAACTAVLNGVCESPVKVKTKGGEILRVSLKAKHKKVTDIYLEGSARFIYSGKLF